jgi:hypothetical protein
MAEKVRDGIDGFHFPVGSAQELGYLLKRLRDDPGLLAGVRRTMRSPASIEQVVGQHLDIYRSDSENVDGDTLKGKEELLF